MKTVSLELAKKLKEVGYPQETDYGWWPQPKVNDDISISRIGWEVRHNIYQHRTYGSGVIIAAPTAEEILAELPAVFF